MPLGHCNSPQPVDLRTEFCGLLDIFLIVCDFRSLVVPDLKVGQCGSLEYVHVKGFSPLGR